jgi:DNA-binding GntR family transcriptional regulator
MARGLLVDPGSETVSADTTKADEIAAEIEEQILLGSIEPGVMLRQEQLAARFGVSRTPIREALRRLDALGLVTFRPNRGVLVRGPSRDDLWDSILVRASLEATAAEVAATRITTAQLDELSAIERRYTAVTQRLREPSLLAGERRTLAAEWARGNDAFHDLIVAACRMPLLERTARSVRRVYRTLPVLAHLPEVEGIHELNLHQHHVIVEALAARSGSGARALMYEHVITTGELLADLFERIEVGAADTAPEP